MQILNNDPNPQRVTQDLIVVKSDRDRTLWRFSQFVTILMTRVPPQFRDSTFVDFGNREAGSLFVYCERPETPDEIIARIHWCQGIRKRSIAADKGWETKRERRRAAIEAAERCRRAAIEGWATRRLKAKPK